MKKGFNRIKLLAAFCIITAFSLVLAGCGSSSTTTGVGSTTIKTSTTQSANEGKSSISVVPSVSTIKPGGEFDISIRVQNDQPTRGGQFSIRWDPNKVQCVSTEEGSYFRDFVQSHNGDMFLIPSSPAFDNTNGIFPMDINSPLMMAMTGAQGPDATNLGVTGSGDIYILHMIAKNDASGTVDFQLSNVILGDATADSNNMHPTVNNGKITISP